MREREREREKTRYKKMKTSSTEKGRTGMEVENCSGKPHDHGFHINKRANTNLYEH